MISDSDTAGPTQFLPRAEVSEVAQAILDEAKPAPRILPGPMRPARCYAALGSVR